MAAAERWAREAILLVEPSTGSLGILGDTGTDVKRRLRITSIVVSEKTSHMTSDRVTPIRVPEQQNSDSVIQAPRFPVARRQPAFWRRTVNMGHYQ